MGAYFAVVLGIGAYFARRQHDASDYFLGRHHMPWIAVMFSIVATETSALTVISFPGIGARTNLTFLQVAFGYLIGRIVFAVGHYGEDDPRPVQENTIYDLASLTKVIGLTTATMFLVADGALDIEHPVVNYVPEFSGGDRSIVTVRHLLTHTSGLPAWVPLYLETTDAEDALRYIYDSELENPPGEHYSYSDLGVILLGKVVERVAKTSLDTFLKERPFQPLGMTSTQYRPPAEWQDRIAPTEDDSWRGRLLRGEVHDRNAFHLGGISGHAGLFSTAPDLARFAIWMLDMYHERLTDNRPGLPPELVREFTSLQPGPEGSTRALGWDTPTPGGGASSGHYLNPSSFGHTGFTGTSIWVDPVRDLFIILLTNRVHPTRDNPALAPLRGIVADMVVEAIVDDPR